MMRISFSGIREKAAATLASTTKQSTAEIEATRREYEALLEKASAYLAAERKKLDDQRSAMGAMWSPGTRTSGARRAT